MIAWPTQLRESLRWLDRRRSLSSAVRALREVLPGDGDFGDPLSTTGFEPQRVLGRQVWTAEEGRWSALAEIGLTLLQLADWAGEDLRPRSRDQDVAILFTDLVGFSTWALKVGDEVALPALRTIDGVITSVVEAHGGHVVKRLGDGTMAVFADPAEALAAGQAAIRRGQEVEIRGFQPQLRVGLHFGTPQSIGTDYIGVDVNVAARLCEAASADEILMSDAVRQKVAGGDQRVRRRPQSELDGVPDGLALYSVYLDGDGGPETNGKA